MSTFQERVEALCLKRGEIECDTAERLGQEVVQKAKLERMAAEIELSIKHKLADQVSEYRRPFRVAGVVIEAVDGKYRASTGGMDAFGDTPEMAADNFDHLWVYGNENPETS